MKIAVVDDDIRMYELLKTYLGELLGLSAVTVHYPNGESFLSAQGREQFDLIILDIFMDGIIGMDIAKKIRETDREVRIVFCTTSNEFASESYEVDACYYLHKPIDREHVKAMLDRARLGEIENARTVRLPDGSSIILRSIIYADCASHCVTLHLKDGGCTALRVTFAQIESSLREYPYFFSPTKGVIINFHEVSSRSGDTFRMSDGSIIPISRRKAKEVTDAYSSFLFERLRRGGKE